MFELPEVFQFPEHRPPCSRCGNTTGRIETRNGQDCVFCASCGRHCYNAPRQETGRETRSLRTRPDIKPSQRTRIIARDNATCVICHRGDLPLEIGHLLSVADGKTLGLGDAELYNDENLAAMCSPCNSGLSDTPIPLRLLVNVLRARLRQVGGDAA